MDYCFLARIPPPSIPSRLNINLPFRLLTNSRDSINSVKMLIIVLTRVIFMYVIRILSDPIKLFDPFKFSIFPKSI